MSYRTAEESERDYVEAMGATLGAHYAELWQEIVYLHKKWNEYVSLFGSKPERITILNKAASNFFRLVQDVFWDDIILHIARLTDPPATGKNANLTILALPSIAPEQIKHKLEDLAAALVLKVEFCREWRNKLVAHKDLSVALSGTANQIQGGSRDQINAILDSLAEIMNVIASHFFDSTTVYNFDGFPPR